QATKTIADGPRAVQASEQRLAAAKQAQASAAQQTAAKQTAFADRESAVKLASELVNQLKPLAEKNPADTAMRDAAQKAKESLDLLNGELDAARRAASQTSDAAAKAAAELAAAESALAAAKSALAQAPAQLEQARAK